MKTKLTNIQKSQKTVKTTLNLFLVYNNLSITIKLKCNCQLLCDIVSFIKFSKKESKPQQKNKNKFEKINLMIEIEWKALGNVIE